MNLFSPGRGEGLDGITNLDKIDPLDDHLSLETSYLSVAITRSACFGALHADSSWRASTFFSFFSSLKIGSVEHWLLEAI
jgi:hypothetical protein